ncbi:MAG: lanthionine synthetase LanC family protein, partial [Solirubrobacteraceae bacterium]
DDGRWTATALEIAHALCDAAYSHDDRCTWMGTTQDEDEETGDLEFTYRTLGPSLYGGTSGIALFLAEAWARSGESRLRETAERGVRQALKQADAFAREDRLGYYSGTVGVAWAAARAGRLLGRREFLDGAAELASDLPVDSVSLDVIDGAAGAVPALLSLAKDLASPALREVAITLGHRIVDAATIHESGAMSWAQPDADDDQPHLTGFAHGAAGIGWSLLELFRISNERRFLDAAHAAFQYENEWFRADIDNWPDFREALESGEVPPCGAAWCHGAPGIGLSRLRALELTADDRHRDDARAAMRTAMRTLAAQRDAADPDWSLCHGLAGICDLLLYGSRVLADESLRAAVVDAAAIAAHRYRGNPGAWPVGVLRGSNPSLMLGTAGIGFFFLRLADPTLASPLRPGAR